MRISDWSSDVCSSDLYLPPAVPAPAVPARWDWSMRGAPAFARADLYTKRHAERHRRFGRRRHHVPDHGACCLRIALGQPEHQFVMHIDWKSVVEGKSVSVRLDLGGRRLFNKKK